MDHIFQLPSHRIRAALTSVTRHAALTALAAEWHVSTTATTVAGMRRALVKAAASGQYWHIRVRILRLPEPHEVAAEWRERQAAKRLRAGEFWCAHLGLLPRDQDIDALLSVRHMLTGCDALIVQLVERSGLLDGLESWADYARRQEAAIWSVIGVLDRSLYRCTQTSWAGGNHSVGVSADARKEFWVSVSTTSEKAWSKNGKWSGKNSSRSYRVCPEWMSVVHAQGLSLLDGCICLHAAPIAAPEGADRAWRVKLARQSRGMSVVVETGIAVRFGGGLGYGSTMALALRHAVKPVKQVLVGA